jgi:predicted PurR-regulated permease PerM
MARFLKENAWILGALAAMALVWLLGHSLAPFVVGVIFAYLLQPVVERLAARGWKRSRAALLLVLAGVGLLVAALSMLVPVLVKQARDLLARAPELIEKAYGRLWSFAGSWAEQLGLEQQSLSGDVIGQVAQNAAATLAKVGSGVFLAFDVLVLAFLSVIVVYWLLRDWPRVVDGARRLVPERSKATADRLARKLDEHLSGWVRGVGFICLFQAVYHSLGLFLIGLNSALLIGIATGIANAVPVIGNWLMFFVALGVAVVQFDSFLRIGAVVLLYASSQLLEESVLYPRIVGRRIDLHPLWVIFSLLVFATLFGVAGALLAIPLACIAQVIVEHLVGRYRESEFYRRA